ncbi:Mis14-domain-containing protein [Aspergillus steynii IBT 23096]|uniref:Mis14-domain-containing protein n=1 Tax=Aspergillus steynii IBT 23096 TaxID=1392250 RepID=A0A2I2GJI7_9EURO|nr:Mis14-domain-containing protein [Aspergillus steynii IBT 23096]PLB53043.1 Mis14-domain-containing protein [Aspergillus steynii IBT 23096]
MSMHRKIELQSPADFTYLYANTVALSRQKLDLHLPPSANTSDGPDPMRERVRELVDQYITKTFTTASSSISINGLDSSSEQFPFPASFTAPTETVEYEAYDTHLAARVTSLYAQLESLTTSVAQARRDAPRKAAKAYAEQLRAAIEEDEGEFKDDEDDEDEGGIDGAETTNTQTEEEQGEKKAEAQTQTQTDGSTTAREGEGADVAMPDADQQSQPQAQAQTQAQSQPPSRKRSHEDQPGDDGPPHRKSKSRKAQWDLKVPLGTDHEAERWRNGEVAEVYEDALRTLLRLQGEGDEDAAAGESTSDGNALASTVGKAERARQAVEVVEKV